MSHSTNEESRLIRPLSILTVTMLILLVGMPTVVPPKGRSTSQGGPTYWSPFGPRSNAAIFTVYGYPWTTFNSFVGGQVDIADIPVAQTDEGSYSANPDFYVTAVDNQLGIYQLEINRAKSFLGIPMLQTRTLSTPSVVLTSTTTGCSSGTGRLIVTLENLEEPGNPAIIDSFNTVTATSTSSSGQSFTVHDSDDGQLNGVYVLPSMTGCMNTDTYTLTTSIYSGSASFSVGSNGLFNLNFLVNYNSPSTQKLAPAGIEIGKALAHLIDKPSFLLSNVVAGEGVYDDVPVAPAQGLTINGVANSKLPQSIIDEDCSEHPWFNPGNCHPYSAYNLVSDNIGSGLFIGGSQGGSVSSGYSGNKDLRAACDHFVNAGFSIVGGGGCAAVASGSSHLDNKGLHVIMQIGNDPIRKAIGQIIADSLNFLFGTPATSGGGTICYFYITQCINTPNYQEVPTYYTFDQDGDAVFAPSQALENLYVSYRVLTPDFDQLYSYHSSFASSNCGGKPSWYAQNYVTWCDPFYDTQVFAGAASQNDLFAPLSQAALRAYRDAMSVPVFSSAGLKFAALNGWNFQPSTRSSLVSQLGHGFELGFWSLLNMQQVPGYNPCTTGVSFNCAALKPGGGNPGIIRRSVTQTISRLSPFQARTQWELDMISQIYDTMLRVNPLTGGSNAQIMDWMTKSHTSTYNDFTKTTTLTWNLRGGLKWQDGQSLTSDDVAYTILAYRDVPSFFFQPNVARVLSATSNPNSNTVTVTLSGQSPAYELQLGGLPIIPKHVWSSICGNPPNSLSWCADSTFDPMASGVMVGSGPWMCKSNTGWIGGPCTYSSGGTLGQILSLGDYMVLLANNGYFRGLPPPTPGTSLGSDPKIKFVDTVGNGVWGVTQGFETIVYDANNNNVYDSGDSVIAGTVPPANTPLKSDPKIKFIDSNNDNAWEFGETIVYDSNSNNVYDAAEPVVYGSRNTSLHDMMWADKDKDGAVNILDIADIGLYYGKPNYYWDTSENPSSPDAGVTPGQVDIGEVSTVAFYYGGGLTVPFTASQLTGLDPCIDPFLGYTYAGAPSGSTC